MIEESDIAVLLDLAARHPNALMTLPPCRRHIAVTRWQRRQRLDIAETTSSGVMPGTITHNRQETEQGLFGSSHRTQRLIGPLSALEPVYSTPGSLKALSIGPRTEMELLHLIGIGLKEENIRGLDLISSSPLIDVGDMHALPYPDHSFDVVISGWALAYSSNPKQAIHEMARVCKRGGLIALGATYDPSYGPDYVAGTKDDPENIVGTMFRRVRDFAEHFPVSYIPLFCDEPPTDESRGAVLFVARLT